MRNNAWRILTSENKSDKKIAERVGVFFPNQDNRGSMVNISALYYFDAKMISCFGYYKMHRL